MDLYLVAKASAEPHGPSILLGNKEPLTGRGVIVTQRNKEEKRKFAQEQFNLLCERGFSRRIAGDIMRIVGPRLAVKCAEWANHLCEHFKQHLIFEDAKTLAHGDAADIEWVGQLGIEPDDVRYEVEIYLREAAGILADPGSSSIYFIGCRWEEGRVVATGEYVYQYKEPRLRYPSPPCEKREEFLLFLKGAELVLPHIKIEGTAQV